ncbi:MAG TPA: hydrogenase expression/formation protein HypE [Candidatus Cybelea sp.]|nr:hydrogenase expression/formation protein HypE [Candidatus Cybelea sp.]
MSPLDAVPKSIPRRASVDLPTVTLAHGGGGRAMRDLIDGVFLEAFGCPELKEMNDAAVIALSGLAAQGDRLAFTTDSFVVDPLVFPGGDIGKLAVCGTINDLAVSGARPLYLTCAVILEEGFPIPELRRIVGSMASAAREAEVAVVTGDTKVVGRGACDKLFINTAGIGVIEHGLDLGPTRVRPGDVILVNGLLGDHGATILNARGDLALSTPIESDCAALHDLIGVVKAAAPNLRFLRDATRGGLATVLNEVAESARVGIALDESAVPIRAEVKGFCEILGLDPLYLANEGKLVAIVPEAEAPAALAAMRGHRHGAEAAVIGRVTDRRPGRVTMRTVFGGERVVDMLVGDQLPRIC